MEGLHDGHRERLRAKYANNGLDGFFEHEALELLLTYAIPRRNTNDIAHRLLSRFGSLRAVFAAQVNELTDVAGVGERTAVFLRLVADMPAYMRVKASLRKGERINTPLNATAFALDLMQKEKYECVYVVSLNKNYELLHAERLLTGTLTETPLYPRRVVESALRHSAYAVLLLHNHPSGDPTPSESDRIATAAVGVALGSIDIKMYDHIVVGRGYVYSFTRDFYIDSAQNSSKTPPRAHTRDKERIAAEKKL